MENTEVSALGKERQQKTVKLKCLHKKWIDAPSGIKAVLTDLCLALQMATLAFLYAFFAFKFKIFFYISLGLTVLTAAHVFICERDAQSKSSWLFLFLVSFGCGYIVYILANRNICYGYDMRRYQKIYQSTAKYLPEFKVEGSKLPVKNDCEYLKNAGGYYPYQNTGVSYFSEASLLFDDLISSLETAEEFIFLEYFIVADGKLLQRFYNALARKAAQGVNIRFLYDDAGSQGVLSAATKKRLRAAGINFKPFSKMFAPFNFAQDYRDHRKIVVVDGKVGYVGGCNIDDACLNLKSQAGIWKDAGLKLSGAAVDGLSLIFMRQWQLSQKESLNFGEYLNRYEQVQNGFNVVPYAGGPETEEFICRGIYGNVIAGAREKLYIMTPYLIPDGDMFSQIKAKAKSGVDVRIVLPALPDYPFIYTVTKSNAERLIKCGVKIYYVPNTFVHSKVMLTENCVTVGSVNIDMRAFYLEFDNGVYCDDKSVMAAAQDDFEGVFAKVNASAGEKRGFMSLMASGFMRIFSPLM